MERTNQVAVRFCVTLARWKNVLAKNDCRHHSFNSWNCAWVVALFLHTTLCIIHSSHDIFCVCVCCLLNAHHSVQDIVHIVTLFMAQCTPLCLCSRRSRHHFVYVSYSGNHFVYGACAVHTTLFMYRTVEITLSMEPTVHTTLFMQPMHITLFMQLVQWTPLYAAYGTHHFVYATYAHHFVYATCAVYTSLCNLQCTPLASFI